MLEAPDPPGLGALAVAARLHLKLHALPFAQGAEAIGLNGREVYEHVGTFLLLDETVAFFLVLSLYDAFVHAYSFKSLSKPIFGFGK